MKNLKSKLDNKKGFTLVEVIIAMSVFSIGILAIIGLMISAVNTNTASGDYTAALGVATANIEALVMEDFDLSPGSPLEPNNSALPDDFHVLPNQGIYRVRYRVLTFADAGINPGLAGFDNNSEGVLVRMEVAWGPQFPPVLEKERVINFIKTVDGDG
jgi:prepilin-type N-terminal cleavage/methylation domain-containing protein